MIEDGKQPFAACVIEALARREVELGQEWTERAGLAGEPSDGGRTPIIAPDEVVRAVLAVIHDEVRSADPATRTGRWFGIAAHRRGMPLHQMLEELDCLEAVLLRAAEHAAAEHAGAGDGLVPAQAVLSVVGRICRGVSAVRLAAAKGYARAIEKELRERYRAIRHDLRNPLGTIKSAIALLTDENLPAETRQGSRVRAMVARNARSLDQMIAEALGDDAAALPALSDSPPGDSARKQRDDLRRTRQRPDLESGAL